MTTVGHALLLHNLQTTNKDGVVDMRWAYMMSVGLWATLGFIMIMTTATFIRETLPKQLLTNNRSLKLFLKECREALLTREFLSVAIFYACCWISINFLQSNMYLFVKYVIQDEPLFFLFILLVEGVAILSLAVWSFVSRKIGKKNTAYIGFLIFIPACIGFGLLGPHQVIPGCFVCAAGGLGLGNMLLMPWSMLPDVMELDEMRCGYRREGVFYSWFVLVQKLGIGLSLGVSSLALGWAGFIPPSELAAGELQPPMVITTLRLIISAVPILLFLVGFIAVYNFPISRSSHAIAAGQVIEQRRVKLSDAESTPEEDGDEPLSLGELLPSAGRTKLPTIHVGEGEIPTN